MKSVTYFLVLILLSSCVNLKKLTENQLIETGMASWYGPGFQGKTTANGETFDTDKFTAAHRTLPFNSRVLVVNTSNNKSVTVRINDRGPYVKDRIMDLSKAAAERLEMTEQGTAQVELYLRDDPPDSIDVEDLKKPSYTVQVGSFSNHNAAKQKAAEISDGWVKKVWINREKVYRVFVGKFDNVEMATVKKVALENKGIAGFVKQVEN